ncbi:hypothetical protein LUW74_26050 [Actinomadura madurae]|uniref:hypothetical protein n=1 Tax=Actinomadura madurae TaxID=1993 RepID=UPI0020266781|nr:hypothetical protein [Actinomadura madurae]URN06443.1 hypothetical protein LUW74_26050 [Actinomadura madurae]
MTVGGMAAVTRIQHPEHVGQALDQYGRAFQRHGQLAHFEYDTSGNTIEGSGANGAKGIKRKGFGVGLNNEQMWAKYRSGRYLDYQAPQAGWQALANCPQG